MRTDLVQLPVEEGRVGVLPQVSSLPMGDDAHSGILVLAPHLQVVKLVPVQTDRDGHITLGRSHLCYVGSVAATHLLALPTVERVDERALAGRSGL